MRPHVVDHRLFLRDATDDPESRYLPATITGYDTETQKQHQLQLHPDQPESPPPSAPTGPPVSVDKSKAGVRLVRPKATDAPVAATTAEAHSPPTSAKRRAHSNSAHTDAQTPVHSNITHTDNTNTSIERSAPTQLKGKRLFISTNDLPSPVSVKRKTGKAPTAKKEKPPSNLNKEEKPTNDALLLAFEDPAPAKITSPLSADSPRAPAFEHELPADLPGFLSDSRAKVVSSLSLEPFSSLSPENKDNDVFLPSLDILMTEPAPKGTLRSSRSTDAKASETPVVDDVIQPSGRSSGKQSVKKKVRRES